MEDLNTFKKRLKHEKKSQLLEQPFHGRFLKDTEKMSTERTRQWLEQGHYKKETEAMVRAAQDQAQRINSMKHHINSQDVLLMCSLSGR